MQSLISCLHPPTPPPSPSHAPSPPSPRHPSPTHTLYHSAVLPDTFIQSDRSFQDSIYLSSYEGFSHLTSIQPRPLPKQKSCDPKVAMERYQRQLQLATEEILAVHFSIDEVFLSLSSDGEIFIPFRAHLLPFTQSRWLFLHFFTSHTHTYYPHLHNTHSHTHTLTTLTHMCTLYLLTPSLSLTHTHRASHC